MKLKITYSNYMQLTITRWLIDDYSGAFSNRLTPLLKLEYLSFLGFTRYPPVAMNSTVKLSASSEPIYSNWTIQKCNWTILRHLREGQGHHKPSLGTMNGLTPPKWNWLSPILWSTQHCATYIPHFISWFLTRTGIMRRSRISWLCVILISVL